MVSSCVVIGPSSEEAVWVEYLWPEVETTFVSASNTCWQESAPNEGAQLRETIAAIARMNSAENPEPCIDFLKGHSIETRIYGSTL
jgi:hypothetical protein